jgi:hypothetical protein
MSGTDHRLIQVYHTSYKMAVKAAEASVGIWNTENAQSLHSQHNGAERKNRPTSPGAAPSTKTKQSPQKPKGNNATIYELCA